MGTAGAWTAYRPPAAPGVRACIGEMIHTSGDTRHCRRQRAGSAVPTFGEAVRRRRLARGLSLQRLVQLLGASPTCLSLVERGKAAPPPAACVARMARLLGESADALIALAGYMSKNLVQHARRLNAGNRRFRS